jgi:hypothetical protein
VAPDPSGAFFVSGLIPANEDCWSNKYGTDVAPIEQDLTGCAIIFLFAASLK